MNQARSKTLQRVLVTLPALACMFGPCMGVAHAIGQPEAPKGVSRSGQSGPLRVPRVQLTPMPGFNDDAAYMHSVSKRVADLLAQSPEMLTRLPEFNDQAIDVDSVPEPAAARRLQAVLQTQDRQAQESLVRSHLYQLAAANQVLAFLLEPLCSRRIHELPTDPNEFHPDEIGEKRIRFELERVDTLLTSAEVYIEHVRDPTSQPDKSVDRVREQARTLRAFSGALRAYLLAGRDIEGVEEIRQAASLLSPLMERDDPRVVAAATFWQALLRSLEDDPDRALSVLELALTDPPPDSMPYAFFSRLLRCRLIAQRGGIATALALLLQLEERCLDWFADDDERAAAIRAIQLERIHLMTDWREQLPTANAAAKRRWCRKRAAALVKEAFADPGDAVLRLTPAIPMLAEPSKTPAQLPAVPREGE